MKKTKNKFDPPEARKAQLNKGVADMALLLVLRGRAHYGLEILEALNGVAGLGIADGTIYPLLHRLERQGFIAAEWVTDTPNGRPRKYYRLTEAGRATLDEMIADWRRVSGGVERLLTGDDDAER
ncbi:PadR family transcriptional regulator [Hyphococcus sp.]|uniref:PadR family transcriptional regulator n=1 Tax=Hyphococcus sp. TaxID=2038636 RepID=UPI0035C740BA